MLRMAVVGLGMGGGYGSMLHKMDGVEFAAMCDLDQEKIDFRVKAYKEEIGAEPAPYLSVTEMLANEKLDGVVICVPSSYHHVVAEEVAAAGINMLIDKPVDINGENIDKINKAVTDAGVLCGVIYPMRVKPLFAGVKKAIDDKLMGDLLICDIRLKFYRDQGYYDRGGWRGTWAVDGGGSLMNQGAHPLDLLCWYCGKPKSVIGSFGALNHEIETEDWASGVVEFENGARASISTTTCAPPKNDFVSIDVHGQDGSIYLRGEEIIESSVENLAELNPPAFEHQVHDFVDAVANNRPPMVSLDSARQSVDLINALYESGREGKKIEL